MCGDTLSSDPLKRLAYNIAVAIFAYIAPLITIFYSYFRILYVLQKRCDRRTFRFVKCRSGSKHRYETDKSNHLSNGSTKKNINQERTRTCQALEQQTDTTEINRHNMKTITRAKLKTLKLTALIGKQRNIHQ
jgi:hypothetical protein